VRYAARVVCILSITVCVAGCGPVPLNRAGRPAGAVEGVTSVLICPRCLKQGGDYHVCGRTGHCPECGVDHGAGHVHGVTRYCPVCRTEVGRYHKCGVTRWCPKCRQEAGPGHVCGRTRYCPVCGKEVEGVHGHPETTPGAERRVPEPAP
jgi:hypothetical protein